jgi:signal transduction histidine kinase
MMTLERNLSLDRRFAQSLVDIVAAELNQNVIITDNQGVIIAAFRAERIGQTHEAAASMLSSSLPREFAVTAADVEVMEGVRQGFNVPVTFRGKCVGVLGVTGEQATVAPYARLAARFVEAALESNSRQEQLLRLFREKKALQSTLLNKLMAIQEEERKQISRELHDEAGQVLTSIIVGLRILSEQVERAEERKKILEMRDLTAQTLETVRRLAIELRPMLLDDLGLEVAIGRYVENYRQQYGITVETEFTGINRMRFSSEIELTLYRILQEALTNIAKHADASQAAISLVKMPAELVLVIRDNGKGFAVNASQLETSEHLGLYGMKERVSLLDGSVAVQSLVGHGTTVTVKIPLP